MIEINEQKFVENLKITNTFNDYEIKLILRALKASEKPRRIS